MTNGHALRNHGAPPITFPPCPVSFGHAISAKLAKNRQCQRDTIHTTIGVACAFEESLFSEYYPRCPQFSLPERRNADSNTSHMTLKASITTLMPSTTRFLSTQCTTFFPSIQARPILSPKSCS